MLYMSVLKGDNNNCLFGPWPHFWWKVIGTSKCPEVKRKSDFSLGGRECLDHVLLGLNWVVIKKKKKENSLLGLMNPREPFQSAALSYSILYSDLESETSSKQVLSLTLFCILQMSHLAKFLRATCIQLVWLPSCRSLGNVPFSVLMPQMPSRKPCAHELLVTLTFGPSDAFGIINLWIMAMETENTKN